MTEHRHEPASQPAPGAGSTAPAPEVPVAPGHAPDPIPEAAAPVRPRTGDRAVDAVLEQVDRALADDPGQAVAAVTEAHRLLQARLAAPPAPPAAPGEARPGPRR